MHPQSVSEDARRVVDQPPAGDVSQPADVNTGIPQPFNGRQVTTVRREQCIAQSCAQLRHVSGQIPVCKDMPRQLIAIGVQPRRRQPDDRVAGLDAAAVD